MCGSRRDVAEEEDRKKNGGQSEVARRGVENNTMGRWRDDAMPHACIGNFSSFSFLPTRSLMEKKKFEFHHFARTGMGKKRARAG